MTFRLKAASGSHTGQTFNLDQDTILGSGDEVDIRLDGLDKRHARIVFEDDRLMLETVGKAWVNGQPTRRQPLKSGDEIRLGAHRLVLQAPGLRPPSVLRETRRQRIGPWTWVAIAAVAIGSLGAIAAYVLTRL